MRKPIPKTCPYCQQPFQASRRNKDYCTDDCRIDANNARAKERYAHFKREAPQLQALQQQVSQLQQSQQLKATSQVEKLQQEVKQLRQQVGQLQQERDSLIVVITVDRPIEDTLTYAGRHYKRGGGKMGKTGVGVSLAKGSALWMPGNTIIYRTESDLTGNYYEYELDH